MQQIANIEMLAYWRAPSLHCVLLFRFLFVAEYVALLCKLAT